MSIKRLFEERGVSVYAIIDIASNVDREDESYYVWRVELVLYHDAFLLTRIL